MRLLLRDGFPARRGVMAIHEGSCYNAGPARLPHTVAAARDVLMLPMFADLTFEQQDYVIAKLEEHAGARAINQSASCLQALA